MSAPPPSAARSGPPPPPSYGVATSSVTPSSAGGRIELWDSSRERAVYDDLANLFSIMKAIDLLESAYSRDAVAAEEYTSMCNRLLSQYRTATGALFRMDAFTSLADFVREYDVSCPRAIARITAGAPATVLHQGSSRSTAGETAQVAEATQNFITLMDGLKLNQRAVDEVYPLLSALLASVNRISFLPPSYEGKSKMEAWLAKLNAMRASDDLTEDQARQLQFETEQAYDEFHILLRG